MFNYYESQVCHQFEKTQRDGQLHVDIQVYLLGNATVMADEGLTAN